MLVSVDPRLRDGAAASAALSAGDAPSGEHEVGLVTELQQLAGVINRANGELIELVVRALAARSWAEEGIRSPAHWLVVRAGLSPGRAATTVRIAQRSAELPATLEQLSAGDVSLEQAEVVARHVPAHYEAEVAKITPYATVTQLSRAVRGYMWGPDRAAEARACEENEASGLTTPDPASAAPQLRMSWNVRGRFVLHLDAPVDAGAVVEKAIREAKDALFSATPSTDAREDTATAYSLSTPTLADGLIEMAHRSLAAPSNAQRRDAYRVYLHLDSEDNSTSGSAGITGWVNGRPHVPAMIWQRLTCDGLAKPLWHTDGKPVSVGRAQRIVPQRTRRLIHDRDRGCRFPGCGSSGHVDIHHIVHWASGGATDTVNLVSLCPFHHDGHHRGDFTMRGDADAGEGERRHLRFVTPAGREIGAVPPPASRWRSPDRRPPPGPSGYPLILANIDFEPQPPLNEFMTSSAQRPPPSSGSAHLLNLTATSWDSDFSRVISRE